MQHSKGKNAPPKQLSLSTHLMLVSAVVERTGQQAINPLEEDLGGSPGG